LEMRIAGFEIEEGWPLWDSEYDALQAWFEEKRIDDLPHLLSGLRKLPAILAEQSYGAGEEEKRMLVEALKEINEASREIASRIPNLGLYH
jgi:hypothetical protein